MYLFKNNHLFTKEALVVNDIHNGWYSKNEFRKLLRRERQRSEHTMAPLSFIHIDLAKCRHNGQDIPIKTYKRFLKKFISLITDYSRDYDIKYFCDPDKIEILLLDATQKDAKIYIKKIVKKLPDCFKSKRKNEYEQIIKLLNISSYPINKHTYSKARNAHIKKNLLA